MIWANNLGIDGREMMHQRCLRCQSYVTGQIVVNNNKDTVGLVMKDNQFCTCCIWGLNILSWFYLFFKDITDHMHAV